MCSARELGFLELVDKLFLRVSQVTNRLTLKECRFPERIQAKTSLACAGATTSGAKMKKEWLAGNGSTKDVEDIPIEGS